MINLMDETSAMTRQSRQGLFPPMREPVRTAAPAPARRKRRVDWTGSLFNTLWMP